MVAGALLALALAAAPTTPAAEEARRAMQEADRQLSRASEARDADAFAALLAADTVFLSESGPPALGRAGVRAKWAVFFDPAGPSLTWEPVEAVASDRGDLGYTRGRFVFTGKDAQGKPLVDRGEYLTVWRKDGDGEWRVAADSSLPGTAPGPVPTADAPTRMIGQGGSGDLRYVVLTTRLPPVTATRPSGPYERRVVRIERRNPDGTWSKAIEAVTVGEAPALR